MRILTIASLAALTALAAVTVSAAAAVPLLPAPTLPPDGKPAPNFALEDLSGKRVELASLRGRSAVLAFFCGCDRCHAFATLWAQMLRSGAIGSAAQQPAHGGSGKQDSTASPRTIVVFIGDAAAARQFERDTGLAGTGTLLLPDPALRVTNLYHAEPCPRLFVVDARGVVHYANRGRDDDPMTAQPLAIAARVIDALRAAQAPRRPEKEAAAR